MSPPSGRTLRSSTRRNSAGVKKSTPNKKSPKGKPVASKSTTKPRQTRLDQSLKPVKQIDRIQGRNKYGKKEETSIFLKQQDEDTKISVQMGQGQCIQLEDKIKELEFSPSIFGSPSVSGLSSSVITPFGSQLSQRSQEEEEELLRDFDLNGMYGACRGISRRERYERAICYQLTPVPSQIILEILDEHKDDLIYNTCIWDQSELQIQLRNQNRKIKPSPSST